MARRVVYLVILLVSVLLLGKSQTATAASPTLVFDDVMMPVSIPDHAGSFVMQVRVAQNPVAAPTATKYAVLVHGYSGGPEIWDNFVTAWSSMPASQQIAGFIMPALPGHDLSTQPRDVAYGALTMDDYAQAVIAVLDKVNDPAGDNYYPTKILVGHSMGGMLLPIIEERLITDRNQTLMQNYGITGILDIAPVPTEDTAWSYAEGPTDSNFLSPLLIELIKYVNWKRGVVTFSSTDAINMWYTGANGLVSTAPTTEQIAAFNFSEPLRVSFNMCGFPVPDGERASVGSLRLEQYHTATIAMADDTLMTPDEICAVHEYNTGKSCTASAGYTLITGTGSNRVQPGEAVHGLVWSDPDAMDLQTAFNFVVQ
ncbi:MAG: alpha/beta hydrolase [Patescibacteria group bacterium]|jgi:pimeloyl-ACP methyl ester carboxylesterase